MGAFAIILVSLVLSLVGVYNLVKLKKYLISTLYLIFFTGYPLLLYIFFTTDYFSFIREIPEWLSYLTIGIIVFLSPVWLLSGIMISGYVRDIELKNRNK